MKDLMHTNCCAKGFFSEIHMVSGIEFDFENLPRKSNNCGFLFTESQL